MSSALAFSGCADPATSGSGTPSQSTTAANPEPELASGRVASAVGGLAIEVRGGGVAIVRWETKEPALGAVRYGVEQASARTLAESGAPRTQHELELTGLRPGARYFASVQADARNPQTAALPDDAHAAFSSTDGPRPRTNVATFYTGDDDAQGALHASPSGVVWQPFVLSFEGPQASEMDAAPNPFLDYRMSVSFSGPSGQTFEVPGFFDGDGEGGGSGAVWSVRFAPDEAGPWSYEASFVHGTHVAVNGAAGVPLAFDGTTGTFPVQPLDSSAEGFYALGVLECTDKHYLKFRDGPFFLKGGTDSPENFMGYKGFDNTFDQPGCASTATLPDGVHAYAPHIGDWQPGDPYFVSADTDWDSKGIIGALNYLSSVGVNSIYFLPMNMGGDGCETVPFVGYGTTDFDKTHYDISKLAQWNEVFIHAQKKGILLHFVLGETEQGNENWLDLASLGVQRKLFYRELIARFSHVPALKWNLSEESDFSTSNVLAFADWITALDPYHRPVAFHTHLLTGAGHYAPYDGVLGNPLIGATSLQGSPDDAGQQVELWRSQSANSGHKWVIDYDEQAPASTGLTDTNAVELRKTMLWDVYLSGGQLEWYAGYHPLPLGGDLRLEDFRTREEMWNYTRIARTFVQQLPFHMMEPADHLVSGESPAYGGAEVFARSNKLFAIYYPDASQTGTLDLSGTSGWLNKRWFDPRTGAFLPGVQRIAGGGSHAMGPPPSVPSDSAGFLEEGGAVVIEIESAPAAPGWTEESSLAGFAGTSYYRWTGPNHFSTPGHGILAYDIEITTPGDYRLLLHNRHDHPQIDQENDVWVRMDGGPWFKLYSNNGNSTVGVWNWHSKFDLDVDVDAHFELSSGAHRLEFSGRSHGFMLDRFHLVLPSVPNPENLALPESDYGAGTAANEDWVVLIRQT